MTSDRTAFLNYYHIITRGVNQGEKKKKNKEGPRRGDPRKGEDSGRLRRLK